MQFIKTYFGALFVCLLLLTSCRQKQNASEDNPAYHNPLVLPLTEAIAHNPENAELFYQRSEALLQVEAPELAKKDIEQALKIDTANLKFLFALGQVNITLKDAKGAVQALNKLLAKASGSGPAKILLSKAYLLDNKPDLALKEIHSIIEVDSSYPGALYGLAQIELFQKDTVNAIATLRQALKLRSDDYAGSLLLAESLASRHQREAVKQFRTTFNMDTTDVTPLVSMGKFLEQEHLIKDAKKAYYECLIKDPDCTPALINMGLLLMQEDSLKKALRQFNMAIQTRPNSAEAYYRKGICFEKLKLKDSARNAFRQALVFAPNDTAIKNALQRK